MKKISALALFPMLLTLAMPLQAADSNNEAAAAPEVLQYQHEGRKYPPLFYQSNIEDEKFRESLLARQAFNRLDKDAVGLPIGLMVLKTLRPKADAAGFTSTMLAAGTLGLVPMVNSKEFTVYYMVFVHGERIARFEYSMSSADVEMLWGAGQQRDIKPEEEVFLENTIPRFLNDLKKDEKVSALFDEYYEYFPEGS
ncbi:hypothetical protein NCG89_14750 [Spongiibacter taiwanensis]|uniref:hypothetical protein n=1 Tax=Spongiibacter taiwanensis TaxID=1748242 RepID=UPI002036211C|nr:hypothetical protein [Spongiibacter taiwanensis]USA42790.1 hypothetical protein NCG89_14750 [Spongiibacter taiwanensis]